MSARDPYEVQDVSEEALVRLQELGLLEEDPDADCDDEDLPHAKPWNLSEDLFPDPRSWPDTDISNFHQGTNREAFDLMERMLGLMNKREDPSIIANRMRVCFGNAHNLYNADRYILEQMGVNHLDALFLSMIPDVVRYAGTNSYGLNPQVGRFSDAAPYLISNFIGLQDEYFYLYCVNPRGTLKMRVLLHQGVEDRALLSMRKLMVEVLHFKPSAIILAHNHPGETLRPSQADIDCTLEVINSVGFLNAPLLDHVIVAGHQAVSMRENGFIPEKIWMNQNPRHYLLRNWLLPAPPKKPAKPKVLTPEQQEAARLKQLRIERNKCLKQMRLAKGLYRRSMETAQKAMRVYKRMEALEAKYQQQLSPEND